MRCVRSLGRIISRWRDQIVAWHQARVPSNGSTEAVNNLVKRVKRVAFGIINFRHYHVRARGRRHPTTCTGRDRNPHHEPGPNRRGARHDGRIRDPGEGVGPYGEIVTGVDRRRVPTVFEPVVAAAVAALTPGTALYLYGSVATGRARVDESDVDLLSVGLPGPDASALGAGLSRRFGKLCRGVEGRAHAAG